MNEIQSTNRNGRRGMDPRAIVAVVTMLYGLSPIDVIPDFIPIAGQADDVGVILLAVVAMLVMTMAGAGRGGE